MDILSAFSLSFRFHGVHTSPFHCRTAFCTLVRSCCRPRSSFLFSLMPGLKGVCDQTQLRICTPLVKIQWVVPLRWDQEFLLACKPVLGACKVLGCRSLRIPGSLPFQARGNFLLCSNGTVLPAAWSPWYLEYKRSPERKKLV